MSSYCHDFDCKTILGDGKEDAINKLKAMVVTNDEHSIESLREDYRLMYDRNIFNTEYSDKEIIGRGGFGEVYKARSIDGNISCAIKVIKTMDIRHMDMICREVGILSELNHPHIVKYRRSWVSAAKELESLTQLIDDVFHIKLNPKKKKEEGCQTPGTGGENSWQDSSSNMQYRFVQGSIQRTARVSSTESDDSELFTSDSEADPDTFYVNWKVMNPILRYILVQEAIERAALDPSTDSDDSDLSSSSGASDTEEDDAADPMKQSEADPNKLYVSQIISSGTFHHGGCTCGWKKNESDRGLNRKEVYIEMEYCHTSLEEHLYMRNASPIPVDGKIGISIFRQLMSALEYIHGKKIIHRDIKPANMFLMSAEEGSSMNLFNLRLGDFGLSCSNEFRNDGGVNPSIAHTKIKGTPGYAAPEQITTTDYGTAADLFPSGIILLELFYKISTKTEKWIVIDKLINERELPKDFTNFSEIASLVLRLTSHHPEDRPTAHEVRKELEELTAANPSIYGY